MPLPAINQFDIYISEIVLAEIQAGDPAAAKERLANISQFKILRLNDKIEQTSELYVKKLGIPKKAAADAIHLAVASFYKMDYLITWNCSHIANGAIIKRLLKVNSDLGLNTPVICTPEELME